LFSLVLLVVVMKTVFELRIGVVVVLRKSVLVVVV
jgi:hypothetical protein